MKDNQISRRTMLKIISAGFGVVVASSLPRKWVKPVIDAGLLPVHAQTTSPTATSTPEPAPTSTPGPIPTLGPTVTPT